MRILAPLAAIFGLALLTALIAYFGFASVLQALVSSRWGTVFVIAARAAALSGGRHRLVAFAHAAPSGRVGVFIGLRFCRERHQHADSRSPWSGVTSSGRDYWLNSASPANSAIASVLVDIFLQVVGLTIFLFRAGLGIVSRFGRCPPDHFSVAFIILALAVPAVTGFFLTLNFGAFRTGRPAARRIWRDSVNGPCSTTSSISATGCSRSGEIIAAYRRRSSSISRRFSLAQGKSGSRFRSWVTRSASPKRWRSKASVREPAPSPSFCRAVWAFRTAL